LNSIFDILESQRNTSLIYNKQKSLPQNPRATVKSKEKSASDHMIIAEKKLNHYQKHQQSKPTSSTSLSTKSKPKEDTKNPPKLSKVCEILF
jgi:RNA recognition motif-containing protein